MTISIDAMLCGALPESLEDMTATCRTMAALVRHSHALTALIVSTVRVDFFDNRAVPWIAWCRDVFALEGTELHHRRELGDCLMLIRTHHSDLLPRMIKMDCKKIRQLARLPYTQIPAFLSKYQVEKMDRAAVRDAIDAFMGITPKPRPAQPELPGFESAVDTLLELDATDYRSAVRSSESAARSLAAGMALLGAALEYQRAGDDIDVEQLVQAKKALLDEAADIDAVLARVMGSECAMAHSDTTAKL